MKIEKSTNNNSNILLKLIAYLKPYKVKITFSFFALIAVTASELLIPVIIQKSVDGNIMVDNPSIQGLLVDSLLLLCLLLISLVASFIQVYLMSMTGQGIMKTLRLQLVTHISAQALSFFGKNPVGTLVTRVTNDVETINEFFSSVVMTLIKNFVVMIGVIGVLFFLNIKLAFITILTLPPVIVITIVFRLKAREAYRKVRLRVSELNTFFVRENLGY